MKKMRGVAVTAALLAPVVFGLANASALTVEGDALPEAINGSITLTENVNSCITVEDGDNIGLYLNQKTLVAANKNCSPIKITGGKLWIESRGEVRNFASEEEYTAPVIEQRGGFLGVYFGTFKTMSKSPVIADYSAAADSLLIYDGDFDGQINFTGDKFIVGGKFSINPEESYYSSDGVNFSSQASAVKDGYSAGIYGSNNRYHVFRSLSGATLNKTEYTLTKDGVFLDISFDNYFYDVYIDGTKSKLAKNNKDIAGTMVYYGCDGFDNKCGIILRALDVIEDGDYDLILVDRAGNTVSVPIRINMENTRTRFEWAENGIEIRMELKIPIDSSGVHLVPKILKQQTDDSDIKFIFNFTIADKDNNVIDLSNNEVTFRLKFDSEALGGNYKYLRFASLDEDGKIQEWFDPEEDEYLFDRSSGTYYEVSFKTPYLSTFAVLASNQKFQSTKDEEEALGVPNTGGGEAGVISGAIVAGTVILACLVSSIVTLGSYAKIQKIVSFPTRFLKKMKK